MSLSIWRYEVSLADRWRKVGRSCSLRPVWRSWEWRFVRPQLPRIHVAGRVMLYAWCLHAGPLVVRRVSDEFYALFKQR